MKSLLLVAAFVWGLGGLLPATTAYADDRCGALADLNRRPPGSVPFILTDTKVVEDSENLPSYCRVQGQIAPSIGFELRLPKEGWNGKFLMQGCGGLCGVILIEAADDALARGYAVVASNMGHVGTPFSGIWAQDNRKAEIDFAYRATHVTTSVAKLLTKTYYELEPRYSYYRGCSTGGRQGLVAAQKYPDDFDGIIAGAPVFKQGAVSMYHLGWIMRSNRRADGSQIVDGAKLPDLNKWVIGQCDALDGREDGLIEDPRQCKPDLKELSCGKVGQGEICFNDEEQTVIAKAYEGATTSDGERLLPGGLARGSEYEWAGSVFGISGEPPLLDVLPIVSDAYRYMLFTEDKRPDQTYFEFDYDRDPALIEEMVNLYSPQPELSDFSESGGKLIVYHGWDDLEIPPFMALDYYEELAERSGGFDATQDFARLFMVPGMAHCRRGPGPNSFDLLTYLETWVETGAAELNIVGYHLAEEEPYMGLPVRRFPLSEDDYSYARVIPAYPATKMLETE